MGWSLCRKQFSAVLSPSSPSALRTALSEPPLLSKQRTCGSLWRKRPRAYTRASPKTIVAVTGTSGKTSVTDFVRQIWTALGAKAASLGTLGVVALRGRSLLSDHAGSGKLAQNPGRTGARLASPILALGGVLARHNCNAGSTVFASLRQPLPIFRETTSTSHATLDDYLAAKLELFDRLLERGQAAIVDADSGCRGKVIAACERRGLCVLSTGFKGASLRLLEAKAENFSTRMRIAYAGKSFLAPSSSRGAFQASNALVAAASLHCGGKPGRGGLSGARKKLEARLAVSNSSAGGMVRRSLSIMRISRTRSIRRSGTAAFCGWPAHRGLWLWWRP